jgi:hypothetical protein
VGESCEGLESVCVGFFSQVGRVVREGEKKVWEENMEQEAESFSSDVVLYTATKITEAGRLSVLRPGSKTRDSPEHDLPSEATP